MATHQQYKIFVKKYNSEFGFRGYSKLRKQELINKIESVLNKSRKEIKVEYKKLKEMKKETKTKPKLKTKPTPKPAPKPTPKKIIYNERTLQGMFPQLIGASIASDEKIYTKDELTNAYQVAEKVLTAFQAREWRNAYDEKYKPKKTVVKKTPVKKPTPKPRQTKQEKMKLKYLERYMYMTGDSDAKFDEADLKLYYNNIDKHIKGVSLSEWKRVYNDKRRVGSKEKEKLEKEKLKKRMKEKKKTKAKAVSKKKPVQQKQYTNEELNKLGYGTSLN